MLCISATFKQTSVFFYVFFISSTFVTFTHAPVSWCGSPTFECITYRNVSLQWNQFRFAKGGKIHINQCLLSVLFIYHSSTHIEHILLTQLINIYIYVYIWRVMVVGLSWTTLNTSFSSPILHLAPPTNSYDIWMLCPIRSTTSIISLYDCRLSENHC